MVETPDLTALAISGRVMPEARSSAMSEGQLVIDRTIHANAFTRKRLCVHGTVPNTPMETSSDRIRALRGDLSRREAAKRIGIPVSSLQAMEERDPSASKHFPLLAKYWGVNLAWVQTGKGPRLKSDANSHSGDVQRQQVIVPIQKNVSTHSRVLRLDPVMIRDAFLVVDNFFTSADGAFRVDVDPDLLARGYEWAQTQDQALLDSIDADVRARVVERGLQNEAAQGVVGKGKGRKAARSR
jgi:hypothetical protein